MNPTNLLPLADRGILAIEASTLTAAQAFLQPVLTQNIEKLTPQNLLYTLHLTPQGRLQSDAFVFAHPKNPNIICLDVAKPALLQTAQRLHGYILGQNITLHDLSQDISISALLPQSSPPPQQGEGALTHPDPRHHAMGHRVYQCTDIQNKTSQEEGTITEALNTYHSHRLNQGIPDVQYDAPPARALPAELSLQHLNAIDFNKGCYVGQEVTARLNYRSAAKKQLYIAQNLENIEPTLDTSPHAPPSPSAPPHSPSNTLLSPTVPLLKPHTTAEVGWLGKPFHNKCLAVIQTRITPETFPHLNLTLPTYLDHANMATNNK